MGAVIKDSIKSTIISLSGAVIGFLYIVFAIKFFEQTDFGFQQNFLKVVMLSCIFTIFGTDIILGIFGKRFTIENGKRGAFLRMSMMMSGLSTSVVILILFIVKPWYLSQLSPSDFYYFDRYYWLIPIAIIFVTVIQWLSGYLRSVYQSTYAYFSSELLVRLITMLNLMGYIFISYSFSVFVILFAFSYMIPLSFLLVNVVKDKDFTLRIVQPLNKVEKSNLIWNGLYQLISMIGILLFFQIDGFLFPLLMEDGLQQNAIYSLGLFIVSIVRMPLRIIGTIAIPTMARMYDNGEIDKLRSSYRQSCVNFQLIGFFFLLLWILNIDSIIDILEIWKQGYHTLGKISIVLMIGIALEMSMGVNFEMISISKFSRANFWLAIGAIVCLVVSSIWLINEYHTIGAAWSFTITMLAYVIGKNIVLYNRLRIVPWDRDSIKVILLFSALLLVGKVLPDTGLAIADIFIKSIIIGISYVLVAVKWRIGNDIQNLWRRLMSIFIKK